MKETQFVDQNGNPIMEAPAREGDALDVGFGGPIGNLMEKLQYAKQVMDMSEQLYPYEKTGTKKSGRLSTADEEIKKVNTTKKLSEVVQNEEIEAPPVKQIPKSVQATPKVKEKQPLYEDENYIYYAKDGVQEDDEYDVRTAPSLSNELLMATQKQGASRSLPNMSDNINEQVIKNSKLPDVIKQSFLKNPLTPPKITAALGGGKLDVITEQLKKQKALKNQQQVQAVPKNVVAVPKKKITENTQMSKREKIKQQLRPIVEELIKEILIERL